jgi:hypothetical protein
MYTLVHARTKQEFKVRAAFGGGGDTFSNYSPTLLLQTRSDTEANSTPDAPSITAATAAVTPSSSMQPASTSVTIQFKRPIAERNIVKYEVFAANGGDVDDTAGAAVNWRLVSTTGDVIVNTVVGRESACVNMSDVPLCSKKIFFSPGAADTLSKVGRARA